MLEALFQPLPMQRIHLQVMREDASRAALALAELGIFHPEPTGRWEERLPEQPVCWAMPAKISPPMVRPGRSPSRNWWRST